MESGRLPDGLVRAGIRYNVAARKSEIDRLDAARATASFVREMDASPIALVPQVANHQHYELPASFFDLVLGPRRKYSCGVWEENTASLADAEALALQQAVQRAGVEDGMTVLDLGCGWGSLTLYLAEIFPRARVVGVSNSNAQAEFIRTEARKRGASGVQILTADMNQFDPGERFDRILSIEMFEHMRNWRRLLSRVTDWLNPEGQFFLHVFTHLTTPYPYLDRGEGDWMSRFFFSGGMMPSHELATLMASPDLELQNRWRIDGTHYTRTANAWLRHMDEHASEIRSIFRNVYGDGTDRWFVRWRIFFMACAEMFATDQGHVWGVSQYLFRKHSR